MDNLISNRYMLVKSIGHGGMADVYVAMDTLLNREVAIKILKNELSNDPVSLIRFDREASASTTLSHPNIVDIYDVGEDKGRHYIVMEYVRGLTLKDLITKRGALMLDETIYFMKQLTSATAQAHKKGIIHRDIKTQNVLIKDDGTLKMADFGISLAANALDLTHEDSVLGSVHYLAPELAKGENATYQSDIYSLGIVMFELLTGDVPFKSDKPINIVLKHINEPMPSVKAINPTIPQAVENIIIKATAKNKMNRYQYCEEMLTDLNECLKPEHANDKIIVFNLDNSEDKTKVIANKADEIADNKDPRVKRKNKFTFTNIFLSTMGIIIGISSIIAIVIILFLSGIITLPSSKVQMPDITGMTVDNADKLLKANDLELNTYDIERILTKDTEKGKIIYSSPSANTEISKGTTIDIVVSDGIYQVMKNYVGSDITTAINDLKQYPKITVIDLPQTSSEVAPGIIISQELMTADMQFDESKTYNIKLIYSSYAEMIIPYSLKNMDINDAKSYLESSGMKVLLATIDTSQMSEDELANIEIGKVVKTSPSMGVSYTQKDDNYITLYSY